jgi:hypothetical protein
VLDGYKTISKQDALDNPFKLEEDSYKVNTG